MRTARRGTLTAATVVAATSGGSRAYRVAIYGARHTRFFCRHRLALTPR
jgi:hypothetical protein